MTELSETDKKLIEATFKILREEGIAKATSKKIAAKAGVNEVTIFRNFKNKNNLIKATKDYYVDILVQKLKEVFSFTEDEKIEDYLQSNFDGLASLADDDFAIMKILMENSNYIPEEKHLISKITVLIIDEIASFFDLKIEQGLIRSVDTKALAIVYYCIHFQSVLLWRIYDDDFIKHTKKYTKSIMDLFYNGMKVN